MRSILVPLILTLALAAVGCGTGKASPDHAGTPGAYTAVAKDATSPVLSGVTVAHVAEGTRIVGTYDGAPFAVTVTNVGRADAGVFRGTVAGTDDGAHEVYLETEPLGTLRLTIDGRYVYRLVLPA